MKPPPMPILRASETSTQLEPLNIYIRNMLGQLESLEKSRGQFVWGRAVNKYQGQI